VRLQLPLERYRQGSSPPGETPSQEGLPLGELHPPLTTWMRAADAPGSPLSRRNRASSTSWNPPRGPLEPIGHPQQGRIGRSRHASVAHRGSPVPPRALPGGDHRYAGELGAPDQLNRAPHTPDHPQHHGGGAPTHPSTPPTGSLDRHPVRPEGPRSPSTPPPRPYRRGDAPLEGPVWPSTAPTRSPGPPIGALEGPRVPPTGGLERPRPPPRLGTSPRIGPAAPLIRVFLQQIVQVEPESNSKNTTARGGVCTAWPRPVVQGDLHREHRRASPCTAVCDTMYG
jgi:hypothetical protein